MPNLNSVIEPKEKVENFISELKSILLSPNFNVARDLDILPKKASEDRFDPYTTQNTMIELGFDSEDVRNELLKIGVEDYSETLIDFMGSTLPPFYVFFRDIQSREIYIKVKIRDSVTGKVFCISFHFARKPAPKPLPYSN